MQESGNLSQGFKERFTASLGGESQMTALFAGRVNLAACKHRYCGHRFTGASEYDAKMDSRPPGEKLIVRGPRKDPEVKNRILPSRV
jgi:hypothetical protein